MKSVYEQFCKHLEAPYFLQPWWLDTVCGNQHWEIALSRNRAGQVRGAMPWYRTHRWGIPFILPPPFSSYGGPLIQYPETGFKRNGAKLAFEKQVLEDLIRQMPRNTSLIMNFQPGFTNALPFHWAGFRVSTRYTYILPDCSSSNIVAAGFSTAVRSRIQKAANRSAILELSDITPAAALYLQTLRRRGWNGQMTRSKLQEIHTTLSNHQIGKCLVATSNHTGKICAALYLIMDKSRYSILFSCMDPSHKEDHALHGLIHEAIQISGKAGVPLDFEGSMHEQVGQFFRSFGGELVPYFQIRKGIFV
jgi:hypothetical protein